MNIIKKIIKIVLLYLLFGVIVAVAALIFATSTFWAVVGSANALLLYAVPLWLPIFIWSFSYQYLYVRILMVITTVLFVLLSIFIIKRKPKK